MQRDSGILWGVALYAPTFIVDPETGTVYAAKTGSLCQDFYTRTILAIPLDRFNMGFSPGNIQSLGVLGTLYPNIRISQGT
ncbi:MAG TPA: hypothetical protein PKU85_03455 [Bacteroidales bacterium]|nr:hypothetical protein [Bacteroidales bacterium]HPW78949.1 hypothetical protein [Bacteroidales bacterium]HQB56506.1 hypothetical protein [Bacteroidales bacterium]